MQAGGGRQTSATATDSPLATRRIIPRALSFIHAAEHILHHRSAAESSDLGQELSRDEHPQPPPTPHHARAAAGTVCLGAGGVDCGRGLLNATANHLATPWTSFRRSCSRRWATPEPSTSRSRMGESPAIRHSVGSAMTRTQCASTAAPTTSSSKPPTGSSSYTAAIQPTRGNRPHPRTRKACCGLQ